MTGEAPPGRPRHRVTWADGDVWELGTRTRVMGILNVTPDSFSDGGQLSKSGAALEAATAMVDQGVDVVDVGGESTRPGAASVGADEECARVLPVIEAVKARLDVRVSIDTMKAEVARRAIAAGADMVNDVTACGDPEMVGVVAGAGVPIVLMHMRGMPRTMQRDTTYDDLMGELVRFLAERAENAVSAGVSGDKIVVDPGIGFGKSPEGNLEILRHLAALRRVGHPVLIGASRKAFIGSVLDLPVNERLEGSLAVAALAVWNGADVVRVHDVGATVRVVRMVDAVRNI